jgi:DNA invertase Pin-like site-specific DNA recombinase
MALVGYARCSTVEQNLDDQIRRLEAAGCEKVFREPGVSGKLTHRPQFDACLEYLRPGDVLTITKLDRAGRSVQHLIQLSNDLAERGIEFKALDQPIDTTTPVGKLFFTMIAAFAEFERNLIIERTHEGLRTARLAGKRPGPKPKLSPKQRDMVRKMHADGRTVVDIAEVFSVSRPVIYRVLEAAT